jgi:hypothetical protein
MIAGRVATNRSGFALARRPHHTRLEIAVFDRSRRLGRNVARGFGCAMLRAVERRRLTLNIHASEAVHRNRRRPADGLVLRLGVPLRRVRRSLLVTALVARLDPIGVADGQAAVTTAKVLVLPSGKSGSGSARKKRRKQETTHGQNLGTDDVESSLRLSR